MLKVIKDQEFGGERPLYCAHDVQLENVTIHTGESSLKETRNIIADNCRFEGKYPFWEARGFTIRNCVLEEGARSGIWYSRNMLMEDTIIHAPKTFRDMQEATLRRVVIDNGQETCWNVSDFTLEECRISNADYLFVFSKNIKIRNYHQDGNYSFQHARNVEIRNAVLNSKDALWDSDDVTVIDSEINGEYLAWYSRNLRLIRCHITGTQPLCYCDNLTLEDCTFGDDADLAFEYSSVEATIRGNVVSVKNPRSGHITADTIGEIIIDGNIKQPADCVITQRQA